MRKRKVWACAVLSAAMAASLMTGCGSSKTTDGGTAASADTVSYTHLTLPTKLEV